MCVYFCDWLFSTWCLLKVIHFYCCTVLYDTSVIYPFFRWWMFGVLVFVFFFFCCCTQCCYKHSLGIICLVMWYGYFHLYKIMPNYILQWLYQFIPLGTIWITFVSHGNISHHISCLVLANFRLFNFANPVAVKWYIIVVSSKNTTIILTFVLLYKAFFKFFFSGCFKGFSWSLLLSTLIMMCLV